MKRVIDIVGAYPEPDSTVSNTHHATVIFMVDEYSVEVMVEIGGNCYGKTILRSLIDEAIESFYQEEKNIYVARMVSSHGKIIEEIFSDAGEVEDCCVGAFISSIQREVNDEE